MIKPIRTTQFRKNILSAAVGACVIAGSPLASSAALEELIVTATKTMTVASDIPMSIDEISGEALANEAIFDLSELSESVPNLIIGDGLGTTNVNIRGMGSGTDRSLEQSVGMFIDGIYMPRSRQYRSPFLDAARVEVLRGPQAVLFGLNSTAGAVSVVSSKTHPGDEFTTEISVSYETEHDGNEASVVIGGSPTDTLGLRLAVQTTDYDGYGDNLFTGKNDGSREQDLVRLTAVWEPTDELSISSKFEHVEFDHLGGTLVTFNDGEDLGHDTNYDASMLPLFDPAVLNGLIDFSSPMDEAGTEQEIDNVAITIDYDINDYLVSAVIGYSDMEFTQAIDLDGRTIVFIDTITHEDYEQKSLELRLSSPEEEELTYIVGLYYQDSDLKNNAPNILNFAPFVGGAEFYQIAESTFDQTTEAWSAFASATWNMNDETRLIVGARYIEEEKTIDRTSTTLVYDGLGLFLPPSQWVDITAIAEAGAWPFPFAPYFAAKADRTSDNFMPEVIIQHDLTPDIMTYAKVGTSAKSGGFAASLFVTPEAFEYDDEEVLGMELGMKASLNDGAGELNLAVFRVEYDDLQVNTFDPATAASSITNAGTSISQGIELETRWAINDWLIVGGSLAYLDAEYDKFTNGPCNSVTPGTECDLSGESMPFAPEFSGNVFADFVYPMTSSINLVAGAKVLFSEDYYTEGSLDPVGQQDAYHKINARIGVEAEDDKWSVMVIGKNLNDEITTNAYQFFQGTNFGFPQAPKTITLQGTYRFGG